MRRRWSCPAPFRRLSGWSPWRPALAERCLISADHSGHAGGLAAAGCGAAGAGSAELTSFPVKEGAVEAIAERLSAWLELPEERRVAAREALVETVRRLWSWEGVARGVIAASAGRLGELPAPG